MRIKGHTEIQLRDARTGRLVQRTHDDNMVTNGVAEFLKNHGVLNDTPFVSAVRENLITELMGGILLFNDTLTENASNTRLTDGVKMTANAAYGTAHTGDPSELGSYDANETGWQNANHSVYRLVYTWTTSQGNGVIKSAALTSRVHGIVGEGNSQSGATLSSPVDPTTNCGKKTIGTCDKAIFMVKNNTMYALSVDATAQEFTIYKAHISDTECGLNDAGVIADTVWEEIETFANPSSNLSLVSSSYAISVRVLTNSVVMMLRANNGFVVVTLNSDMDTISSYADVTATATSLAQLGNYFAFLTSDAAYIICAVNNQTSSNFYKIDISNPVNVSQITKVGTPSFNCEQYSVGKRHYGSNYVYDETQDKFIVTNATIGWGAYNKAQDVYQTDKSIIMLPSTYYNGVDAFRNNGYLATINNLQNAVTKDSTQTMKVIYTLTFS